MLRSLLAALRRYFSRRAARKLIAAQLPRGLRPPLLPFPRVRLPRLLALPPPLPNPALPNPTDCHRVGGRCRADAGNG